MFVKIKMEPQSSKALATLKDIKYIAVDDDATITTLKMEIEQYVNVSAEKQEIRTLTTSFANSRKVKDLCDDRGASIMLYAYDDDFYNNQEPQFVCFIQIYTNESKFKMQEMEMQQSSAMSRVRETTTPNRSLSSETLIAVSETESSESESSSVESDSNLDVGSSNSSDNSLSRGQMKRKIYLKQNDDQKRTKSTPVLDKFSPTLCQYLDEFPKSLTNYRTSYEANDEGSSSDDSVKSKSPKLSQKRHISNTANETPIATDTLSSTYVTVKDSPKCSKHIEYKQNLDDGSQNEATTQTTHISPTTSANAREASIEQPTHNSPSNISSTTNDYNHPCYTINPEKRQYVQCIYSSSTSVIDKTEFENLLKWFVDRFHTSSELCHRLQFMHHSPITHVDGKVWIACMNKETCDWVSSSLSQYSLHPCKVEPLHADSHLCEVVIPQVATEVKNLLDIFKLLEKQNPNLCTLQWCVSNRSILLPDNQEYNTKAVSAFCTNELVNIWVDSKSKVFLDEVHQKLKYCFWEIVFKFVNSS